MKLYHYITKGNSALTEGILSFAQNPCADINYYIKRSGATTHQDIVKWLESCFKGRSRGIRGFTEPIKWHKDCLNLKNFIKNADLFSIDVAALSKDKLLDAIYISPSVMDFPEIKEKQNCDELLQQIPDISYIDYSPIDWTICNDKLGRRFAFVRYYLMIIKDGIIPPQYITLEKNL